MVPSGSGSKRFGSRTSQILSVSGSERLTRDLPPLEGAYLVVSGSEWHGLHAVWIPNVSGSGRLGFRAAGPEVSPIWKGPTLSIGFVGKVDKFGLVSTPTARVEKCKKTQLGII